MPRFGPIKRADLIRCLRRAGFAGPYPGGNHQYMTRAGISVRVPNPHRAEIGKRLLADLLRQAGIARDEWQHL